MQRILHTLRGGNDVFYYFLDTMKIQLDNFEFHGKLFVW